MYNRGIPWYTCYGHCQIGLEVWARWEAANKAILQGTQILPGAPRRAMSACGCPDRCLDYIVISSKSRSLLVALIIQIQLLSLCCLERGPRSAQFLNVTITECVV